MTSSLTPEQFDDRARFIAELARRLHLAGVSSSRLEGAIQSTARALDVTVEIWSAPTGLLLSLGQSGELRGPLVTRVMRLEPADINLSAMVTLDEIAERVIAGTVSVADAWKEMLALDRAPERREKLTAIGSFGLSAAAVAGLLGAGWTEVILAALCGTTIGWIAVAGWKHENVAPAVEAIAAFVATLVATFYAANVHAIALQTVVIASLIVLMPGLTLTNAVAELASQQLVTGTTRFAGAVMTLLKMTFGSVAASQLAAALSWNPMQPAGLPGPPAVPEFVALLAATFSLALLFKTPRRDMLLVMVSAAGGYVLTRLGSGIFASGSSAGFAGSVFFASFVVALVANLYGRLKHRPVALIRVPGIMLLVPGSVGFRGVASVMQQDYAMGLDTGVAVVSALISLAAGLLCGSLLIPPRRYL